MSGLLDTSCRSTQIYTAPISNAWLLYLPGIIWAMAVLSVGANAATFSVLSNAGPTEKWRLYAPAGGYYVSQIFPNGLRIGPGITITLTGASALGMIAWSGGNVA